MAVELEIVVKGVLSTALAHEIDGFTIDRAEHGTTHLVGRVPDQARLLAVLARLNDLTVEVISVNPINAVNAE